MSDIGVEANFIRTVCIWVGWVDALGELDRDKV